MNQPLVGNVSVLDNVVSDRQETSRDEGDHCAVGDGLIATGDAPGTLPIPVGFLKPGVGIMPLDFARNVSFFLILLNSHDLWDLIHHGEICILPSQIPCELV